MVSINRIIMREDFLHFLWKNRLFEPVLPMTSDGEQIEIVSVGRHNHHAGPDFFDARIRIGHTLWAGNVEIHLKSSDWNRHGHQSDPQYRNTILHVVAENDAAVTNDTGCTIPTVQIGWPLWIEYNFRELIRKHDWVNCASQLYKIDPFRIRFFLNGLAVERLQQKIERIEVMLEGSKNNWDETFYRFLVRGFGFSENGDPFEILARTLPFSLLQRHHSSQFQLEALLFGQSGMLQNSLLPEEYPQKLLKEYEFLSLKYGLKPIPGHLWKFMRMHPLNFPTIRLAQLAGILHHSPKIFQVVMQSEHVRDFRMLFRSGTTTFWDNHYTFEKLSGMTKKTMGEESFRLILINVVVPFLFLYGERQNRQELRDRALQLMEELPAENNSILRHWSAAGIPACNSLESQALILLHSSYCEPGRCLDCSIGQKLITHNGDRMSHQE